MMARALRLSALDASFLEVETAEAPFQVGAVAVFDAVPLRGPDGALDRERIRSYLEAALDEVPRYRQRLAWTPLVHHPSWIDDDRFELDRHVHFIHVPPPGDEAALWRLTAEITSGDLDLAHPPWEMWFADGLEGDRVAVIAHVHHCMVDGVAGVRLLETMLRDRAGVLEPDGHDWAPAPAPPPGQLLRDELAHRVHALRELAGVPRPRAIAEAAAGIGATLLHGVRSASDAGINPRTIGRECRFAGGELPLDRIKQVKQWLGGTVNDVLLATVAGALRPHLWRRDVDPDRLRDFRAMLPVNMRQAGDPELGNRVALLLARLPVDEPDARRRYERVVETTRYMKTRSSEAKASELLERIADATTPRLVTSTIHLALRRRAFNVIVTNVPGPQRGLYLNGARMRAFYPIVNLWPTQTLGVALFSYDGTLFWGLHADRDAVPDLDELAADLPAAFEQLWAVAQPR